jgi:RNA polymerase sigma-70 factor (ECF subfamily)
MKGGQLLADVVDDSPAIGLKPQDDAALIQSIAQGNKLALQVLFARHNLRVFRFALRFTHDRATAEAFVSDVFLQVWRNAKRYNGASQASTWVLSITRNLVISRLTRRAQEVSDEAGTGSAEDTTENPVDEVALITGLSRNTVKSRMFYARRELARLLQESGIDREGGTTKIRFPHRRQVGLVTLH